MGQALLKEIEQLQIFEENDDDGTGLLFLEERKQGTNTGERIKRDQALYDIIVELLGKGLSLREVAALATKIRGTKTAISKNTIRGIRVAEGLAIGTYRKRTLGHLDNFIERAAERLSDEVDDIPIGTLGIPMGISIQRAADMRGEPNVRIEHTQKKLYNYDEFINSLPTAENIQLETSPGTQLAILQGIAEVPKRVEESWALIKEGAIDA